MRKVIIILVILSAFGLKGFSQSFSIDSSFSPNFDIRGNTNVSLNNISKSNSGNLIVQGNFRLNFNGNQHNGIFTIGINGTVNNNFQVLNGNGYSNILLPINTNELYFGVGNANGKLIDSLGNDIKPNWQSNFFKTAQCFQGIPYFYPNGSSIFPNGFSQTANGPCPIINPPDTFPGRHLVKVTPQGLWDSTFNAFPNKNPSGVIRYDSSRLLVYGTPHFFSHYNGVKVNGLCRIFHDGSLDTTFTSPLSDTLVQNAATPILTDSSGSIFLVGRFHVNDTTVKTSTLMKLNADGSIDRTFSNYSGALFDTLPSFTGVGAIVETADKGYLVGGRFTSYQGIKKNNIVKLDSNGYIEA